MADDDGAKRVLLRDLCVLPAHRGCGAGITLVERAKDVAGRGATVVVQVRAGGEREYEQSGEFYEALGFAKVAEGVYTFVVEG